MPKITISVRTDRVGSKVERDFTIDDEEWADMDEVERNETCFELLIQHSMIDWNYEESPNAD